jgi:hypothetical protein
VAVGRWRIGQAASSVRSASSAGMFIWCWVANEQERGVLGKTRLLQGVGRVGRGVVERTADLVRLGEGGRSVGAKVQCRRLPKKPCSASL